MCSQCNRTKSNKDNADFRDDLEMESDPNCPLCLDNVKGRIVDDLDSVIAIKDKYPVTPGHLLILTKRHTPDFFTMTSKERRDAEDLLRILQKRISDNDQQVTGFNVGINNGVSAGQTIMHVHIHLIPRRDGDTPNPRGGVRGVIPDKMDYPIE